MKSSFMKLNHVSTFLGKGQIEIIRPDKVINKFPYLNILAYLSSKKDKDSGPRRNRDDLQVPAERSRSILNNSKEGKVPGL